jgi:chemotaxis protein CheD
MANEPIKVGIAESKIGTSPASIITNGLGSCVGVCLWDPVSRIGGMVHVMLPDSTQSNSVLNKAKYADTGIVLLLSELCQRGVNKNRLVAKIAGGAQMFNFPGTSNLMRIGDALHARGPVEPRPAYRRTTGKVVSRAPGVPGPSDATRE